MTDFRLELRESLGLPTSDLTELNRLLTEGVITEGFSDIARKALAKSDTIIKQLQANATVAATSALQKLNSPVGKIALVFAVGALGSMAQGAEDFVNNLSQMDGYDNAMDAIHDIDQQTDVLDDQSVDALEGGEGGDEAPVVETDPLEELKTEKPKIVNMLRTVAKGSTNTQNVVSHLDRAFDHIMGAETKADAIDKAVGATKFMKQHYDAGEALNDAILYLKKGAAIKIKSL